jgi:cell division protein FtsQ
LAAAAVWAGARAPRALSWDYFRVNEVAVEGNLYLGREDVLEALDVPAGANLLTVNLAALGARLAANPWVSEAALQRRLPDRLLVRLVERAPAAVLLSEAAHLVSGDGVILGEAAPEALDALPVLRAPAGLRYEVGERVAPDELHEALRAWRQVQLAPVLGGRRPREVAVMRDGSYVVRLAPEALTLRLHLEGFEAQLKRLEAVLALRGGALEDVEEVDLRFREKVILRPRARQGSGAGDRGSGRRAEGQPLAAPGKVPTPDPRPWIPTVDLRPVSTREGR